MKAHTSRVEISKARKRRMRYFIVIILVVISIFSGLFIKWRTYINSLPDKKVYFQDTFDNEKLKWNSLDAEWKSADTGASGVVLLSRKNYAAPYLMSSIPLVQSPGQDFVCYIKIKPISFANDSVDIISFILPTDPIAVIINKNGQVGIARNLFEKPVYSKAEVNFKENKWHDLYVYVNNAEKKITVYVDNMRILDKDLIGETYPVQEIWLGALWLNGGGNYGAPINVAYDSISLGNSGLMPRLSFMEYILNLIYGK